GQRGAMFGGFQPAGQRLQRLRAGTACFGGRTFPSGVTRRSRLVAGLQDNLVEPFAEGFAFAPGGVFGRFPRLGRNTLDAPGPPGRHTESLPEFVNGTLWSGAPSVNNSKEPQDVERTAHESLGQFFLCLQTTDWVNRR